MIKKSPFVPLIEGEVTSAKEEDIDPSATPPEEEISVVKPDDFSLDGFRVTQPIGLAGVAKLQAALLVHKISDARDFVRLHPSEEYWSGPLCFTSVPVEGQSKESLHLIREDLALEFLKPPQIIRHRLALASKPGDVFFLCIVPIQNLDNSWNQTNKEACERAQAQWIMATSARDSGMDRYDITPAKDPSAFREPNWPTQPLNALIFTTFRDRMIQDASHPALLRKIGARQSLG